MANYQPQPTGISATIGELSEDALRATIGKLQRRSRDILPKLQWRLDLVKTHFETLFNANPQLKAQVSAASSRGDKLAVVQLLNIEWLAEQLNRPNGTRPRAPSLSHSSWSPGKTIGSPSPLLTESISPAVYVPSNEGSFKLAKNNDDSFESFIFGFITSMGGGLIFGGFTDVISILENPPNFLSGPSKGVCRSGWQIPEIGYRPGLFTVGQWKKYEDSGTDFEGMTFGGSYFIGANVALWWDYEGNFAGWTFTFVAAGFDAVLGYARQHFDYCR